MVLVMVREMEEGKEYKNWYKVLIKWSKYLFFSR